MKRTQYALTAGVYTSIPALQFSRRVELREDGLTQVGLLVKYPEDGYTLPYEYPGSEEPVVLGNSIAEGNAFGTILGWPVQTGLNARAADIYCKVTCASGTAVLDVTEID